MYKMFYDGHKCILLFFLSLKLHEDLSTFNKKRFWILMKLECKLFFTCITDVSTAIAKTVA